ncbi:MAG: efflux transporter outer membrane subunit [Phycisphaerales bacterium]
MVKLDLSLRWLTPLGSLAAIAVAAIIPGCALKAAPQQTDVLRRALPTTTVVPPAWKAAANSGPVAVDWLTSFNDPMLEAIVSEAIANNPDLREAAEQVLIAQQNVIVVGAQLLPQVGAVLGARTTNDEGAGSNANATAAYAGVAWELDVWGKLRSQRAAAEAGYEATALDYAYARQSLAATVAKAWYLACETRQLLATAEQSVVIYSSLMDLVTIRRQAGKDTDLDLYDARAKLETAQAEVQRSRQTYDEARRAIEVLLGRYPAAEIEAAPSYPLLSPLPAASTPASLLTRRPDIVAAEREVIAAFRLEEAAKLALLPTISVSLGGGRLDDQVLSLLRLNPWLASAGIGVSIPIYEGGSLQAQIKIATAQQVQAVARYGRVVLTAFREVEGAVANEESLASRLPLGVAANRDRIEAVRIATEQYRGGKRDLLWVSNLQSQQISTEVELVKLQGEQRVNRIKLLLALGSSFDAEPSDAAIVHASGESAAP